MQDGSHKTLLDVIEIKTKAKLEPVHAEYSLIL